MRRDSYVWWSRLRGRHSGMIIAVLSILAFRSADAQAHGSFSGLVTVDSTETPIANADLRLVELDRGARTATNGSFRIGDLPAGRYHLIVRAVGYQIFRATIDITGGRNLDGEIGLTRAPVVLDTVKSSSNLPYPNVPFELQEFESRRHSSPAGSFVTDSVLRRHDNEMMVSILRALPGARFVYPPNGAIYLAGSHSTGSGKPVFQDPSQGGPCIATVYLDGFQIYPSGPATVPPDLGTMPATNFSAVEFYADPSLAPLRFQKTGTSCAIALLWSRVRK